MARSFLNKNTHNFRFVYTAGKTSIYVLTYGDEVNTRATEGSSGPAYREVEYRGRRGEWKLPLLSKKRTLKMYFLDVGQDDATFVVTPNNTKMLVDGGLRDRALGFLIWKYRLDQSGNFMVMDHLFLSHADKDHVQGLIPLLKHPAITLLNIRHNGIGLFDSGFYRPIGDRSTDGRLTTLHDTLSDLAGLDMASGRGAVFSKWISAVAESGAAYYRLDRSAGQFDIGDQEIGMEIISPVIEPDGASLPCFKNKSHTINGNSLVLLPHLQFCTDIVFGGP